MISNCILVQSILVLTSLTLNLIEPRVVHDEEYMRVCVRMYKQGEKCEFPWQPREGSLACVPL